MNAPLAARVTDLSLSFGSNQALNNVSLSIPRGSVFGLLGLNGAGKTTLIRHLLGLHRPKSGRVEVLGGDPIADREIVMRQVGYLSEEDSLPSWMRVRDVIRFCSAIYPTWDSTYAAELANWFELAMDSKLKSLSKGGRARVGLIAAIAHKPDLLILDEPSSGLDPIARGDILEAIIRTVSVEGRTVIFSSHLLDEVHRVCDRVAVLHEGRVVDQMDIATLEDDYAEWIFRPLDDSALDQGCPVDSALDWRGGDGEWSSVIRTADDIPPDESWDRWQRIETRPITLNRLFIALAGKSRREPVHGQFEDMVAAPTESLS